MAYDFDKIARDYDRMNHLMTLGLDRGWRRRAVRDLKGKVLDVACGTGDMVELLANQGCEVTGVDISGEMLSRAKNKAPSAMYLVADAEDLPFANESFDTVTCAFGVRNFVHLEKGLEEMLRVLKPGGRMVILELATPDSLLIRPFYKLYTSRIIPWLGQHIADSREAYTYLPQSIERFPKGKAFCAIVEKCGGKAAERRFTCGVCRRYVIEKQRGRD